MAWRYVGGKEPVGVKILRVDDDGRIGYENIEKAKAKEKKKKIVRCRLHCNVLGAVDTSISLNAQLRCCLLGKFPSHLRHSPSILVDFCSLGQSVAPHFVIHTFDSFLLVILSCPWVVSLG